MYMYLCVYVCYPHPQVLSCYAFLTEHVLTFKSQSLERSSTLCMWSCKYIHFAQTHTHTQSQIQALSYSAFLAYTMDVLINFSCEMGSSAIRS